jgi:hypothetical protein
MSFSIDVGKFAEAVNLKTTIVVRKIALDILRSVVLKTPVDTGRARGNWFVSVGDPVAKTTESVDTTGGTTINAGAVEINSASGDNSIFITNNLPYIGRLENGYSKQAPAGMVAVTMASLQAYIDKAVDDAKLD